MDCDSAVLDLINVKIQGFYDSVLAYGIRSTLAQVEHSIYGKSTMGYLNEYNALVFDCDGVILNSNRIKTDAFYQSTKAYGEDAAQALVDYHVQNGGISRYKKFEYFISDILNKDINKSELDALLDAFADEVKQGLLTCSVADGLDELRDKTPCASWFIVSGGDQSELREVFAERKLDHLFDGGIFGSPDTKDCILAREIKSQKIKKPCLFIGDSKYDYLAAVKADLDFIFMSEWSEFSDYQAFFLQKKINIVATIKDLPFLER